MDHQPRRVPRRVRHVLVVHPRTSARPGTELETGYGFGASVIGSALYVLPMAVAMLIAGQIVGPIEQRASAHGQRCSRAACLLAMGILRPGFPLALVGDRHLRHVGPARSGIGLAYATLATLDRREERRTGADRRRDRHEQRAAHSRWSVRRGNFRRRFLPACCRRWRCATESAFTTAFLFCGVAVVIGLLRGVRDSDARARVRSEGCQTAL